MKAVFIDRFGGPEVLTYGDQPDPLAGPGQVVVDVVAASVNGADWRVRAGQYAEAKFPLILGRDFSGTVSAAAADVHDLKVGDAVFGVLEAGREGAYAEKLAINAAIIAKKPDALSHVHAAAMALTGLTASFPSRQRSSFSAARRSSFKAAPAASRALRSSSPNISAHVSSPPPAPPISTMCAASAPTRSSTTTRVILPRRSAAAKRSSIRSAAMWR